MDQITLPPSCHDPAIIDMDDQRFRLQIHPAYPASFSVDVSGNDAIPAGADPLHSRVHDSSNLAFCFVALLGCVVLWTRRSPDCRDGR